MGVVEEVDGFPASPGRHTVGGPDGVDVVGAVDVAGESHLFVVAGVAGGVEGVVSPDGVLQNLNEGLHIGVVELGIQPGFGAGGTHQGSGDGAVEAVGFALFKVVDSETLKV